MASKTVRDAVNSYVQAHYTNSAVPFKDLDNFLEDLRSDALKSFYAIDFVPITHERRASFGNPGGNRFREEGAFQIHVFVRSNTGSDFAVTQAEALRTVIRQTAILPGLIIDFVDPPNFGPANDEGSWYRATVSVDYQFSTYS